MRSLMLSLVLTLAGCQKVGSGVEAITITREIYPGFTCPGDARGVGSPPPDGTQIWCSLLLPNGTYVRQGPSLSFFANGTIKDKGNYEHDQRQGPWVFFDPEGNKAAEGEFRLNKEEGIWRYYYPNGDVREEGPMVAGGRHGTWSYWSPSRIRNEGTWVNGERDGLWIELDESGRPIREREYRRGRLTNQRELVDTTGTGG